MTKVCLSNVIDAQSCSFEVLTTPCDVQETFSHSIACEKADVARAARHFLG
jgi:hypothetical protein